jgi:copper chaperone CopZ
MAEGAHGRFAMWIAAGAATLLVVAALATQMWRVSSASEQPGPPQSAAMTKALTVSIPVEGMICMVCAASVKRAAMSLDGVLDAQVDLAAKRATVVYVDGGTSPAAIAAAIARLGYKTGAPTPESGR